MESGITVKGQKTSSQTSKEGSSQMKFNIRVPASTSNLGPGFDTLGLALDVYNEYRFNTEVSGFSYTANCNFKYIPSDKELPWDKNNLVYRSFDYLFKKEGKETPAVKIHLEADIPFSGGFGSSSTAIVAGLMAANRIMGDPYDKESLLKIGAQIDGHPDNICPAILGGFVVCVYADNRLSYINLPWDDNLFFVAIIPDFQLPTAKARAALPAEINHKDAVFNVGHSSLLVAAVAAQDTEMLKRAFKDKLHQSYRANSVPGMQYVLDAGIEAGAVGTMLSGAGATLIAVVESEQAAQAVAQAMQSAWMLNGINSEIKMLKAEAEGAKII